MRMIVRVIMIPGHQPVRMACPSVQNFIKYYINEHAGNSSNQHDGWPFNELFLDNPLSGLEDNE